MGLKGNDTVGLEEMTDSGTRGNDTDSGTRGSDIDSGTRENDAAVAMYRPI